MKMMSAAPPAAGARRVAPGATFPRPSVRPRPSPIGGGHRSRAGAESRARRLRPRAGRRRRPADHLRPLREQGPVRPAARRWPSRATTRRRRRRTRPPTPVAPPPRAPPARLRARSTRRLEPAGSGPERAAGSTAPAAEQPATAAETSISVNGAAETVAARGSSRRDTDVRPRVGRSGGKPSEIGVAGGSTRDGCRRSRSRSARR